MKISYNWLSNYIEGVQNIAIDDVSALLTDCGLEVDGIEKKESIKGGLRGLVIGEVLTCTDHPDSDHLHITTVNVGQGEPLNIVCGAPNVAAGQKVVVATIGTVLYNGDETFTIKKSKIRGQESFGMICAEDEIGLGTSHEGIMVLPQDAVVGTPAADYFGVTSDYIIEIGLTPNRSDATSHIGVARDLAALLRVRRGIQAALKMPDVSKFKSSIENPVKIEVQNTALCPRYTGLVVRGVKVAPSPQWMQEALLSIGLKPINNIVDITNYVLMETGQPLHAFDLSEIKGGKVIVRVATEGEKFVTLDGVERVLSKSDLMICNASEPMCIAGVFGGLNSGIKDTTTDIFLESAYFNSSSIRKTARAHGLSTDASFRYERGADPNITEYAIKRAALLVLEIAGGDAGGAVGGGSAVDGGISGATAVASSASAGNVS
ncbi:MAG: phenylalanine--tRNA ligase subunit beta, partial [Bacteroidales bacterium]|nr:phenylalanine--tRNA ligase subunit beta [Bacteroidales bacterium]